MKIAFLGVGTMGRPMLANLVKKGHTSSPTTSRQTRSARPRRWAPARPARRPRPPHRGDRHRHAAVLLPCRLRLPRGRWGARRRALRPALHRHVHHRPEHRAYGGRQDARAGGALRRCPRLGWRASGRGWHPGHHGGRRAPRCGGGAAHPRVHGGQHLSRGPGGERRGGQALQQPDRRGGRRRGERGISHRRGLRRRRRSSPTSSPSRPEIPG